MTECTTRCFTMHETIAAGYCEFILTVVSVVDDKGLKMRSQSVRFGVMEGGEDWHCDCMCFSNALWNY